MKTKALPYFGVLVSGLLLSYSVFFLLDTQTIKIIAGEDGFFETLGALLFLSASVVFFIQFLRDRRGNDLYFLKTKRNVFYLLLAILFFFGFGEEISWGQRIFDLQTPQALEEMNVQGEINLHNLSIFEGKTASGDGQSFWGLLLNVERLFTFFWLAYCVVIPIAYLASTRISQGIRRVNLPLIPIWIGGLFLLNYLVSKMLELYVGDVLQHNLVEIKESNFAFLFAVTGIWLLTQRHADR